MKDLTFLKSNLIAHRGIFDNKRIYENTSSAFERAIKKNYIIELDVRMLKDGSLVVFHDEDLMRLLHVEDKIEKITIDELNYIAKYKIPTLDEVLSLVNGSVPLIIELKTITKRGIFESKVAEILDNYQGLFAIQSFHIKTLKWFYKNRKNYIIGFLVDKKNSKKDYFWHKYDFLNIDIHLFSDKKIKKMRGLKQVLGYTINTKEELREYKLTYDNLVCNNLLEIDE